MYPLIQLDDQTEIVHSDVFLDESIEKVKVYIEKPVEGGFHSVECYLPDYEWKNNEGFTDSDIDKYQEIIESMAHLIFRFAKQGGLGNASNL